MLLRYLLIMSTRVSTKEEIGKGERERRFSRGEVVKGGDVYVHTRAHFVPG